ncbi:MAG: phosphatase PAP2 family protein [Saprospiraceae bacterium]|nr:phosphatase PAP2 family protein [Saprospiraceae bacterium]
MQTIKQATVQVDAKKLQAIKYWDAGAPAYRWNQIAGKLSDEDQLVLLRIPTSWINIAIYDATILAWKEKVKYKRKRPIALDPSIKTLVNTPSTYAYPCEHTVTAAAAGYMLAYFFPNKADSIMQLAKAASQSRIDAGVQFPSDATAAWQLGEQVAKQIIEKAKNDGSAKKWDGKMNKDPQKWTGNYPLGITMATFTPIVLRSPEQFRPQPPPNFEKEMQDLKNFKQNFKSRYLAYFWAENGGLEYWSNIAGQKMFEYRLHDDAPTAARITVFCTPLITKR